MAPIVAGVDSSTQSVKVVLRDADSGELIAETSKPHPDGTEVDPQRWKDALESALKELSSHHIDAISIAGQQHGMVAIDARGEVVRPALLWNDTRSSTEAEEINEEFPHIHQRVGSKLVASFTASKVRWLSKNEPENARKVAAIALPHDWLSWQLQGGKEIKKIFTDRSDASGTGYFDSVSNQYCGDIFSFVLPHAANIHLPNVVDPNSFAGETTTGIPIAAGAGDNAGAALGVGAKVGDLVISLGTSGTAFVVSDSPTHDPSGEVAGFADATGNFLPLACTLNAAKIFATTSALLNLTFDEFSSLALKAPVGADGLRLLPHFDGERTPNRPNSRGQLVGITHANFTRENIARAAIEGVLAGMVYAATAVSHLGVHWNRVLLIGGAAKNEAVQNIAAQLFGGEVFIPAPGEYVADGAAKQAAWALARSVNPPQWRSNNFKNVSAEQSQEIKEVVASYISLISKI